MKEVNFNVVKKVKEYPWFYFKKKYEYTVFQIKDKNGLTDVNTFNLTDYIIEVDNSKPFYERSFWSIKPGYSYEVLTRDTYFLEDIIFVENNMNEFQLQVKAFIRYKVEYCEYDKWHLKSSRMIEYKFSNEMKKFIKIKTVE